MAYNTYMRIRNTIRGYCVNCGLSFGCKCGYRRKQGSSHECYHDYKRSGSP